MFTHVPEKRCVDPGWEGDGDADGWEDEGIAMTSGKTNVTLEDDDYEEDDMLRESVITGMSPAPHELPRT